VEIWATRRYHSAIQKRGRGMTDEEEQMFTRLLFDHKHLWIAFQETRQLKNFPEDDPYGVHCRFCDAATKSISL
jgi:hypothetical protein